MPTSPSVLESHRRSLYLVGEDIDFVGNIASKAPNNADYRCFVPPEFVSNRVARDGRQYHMTILTHKESSQLAKKTMSGDESATAFRTMLDKNDPMGTDNNEMEQSSKKQQNNSYSIQNIRGSIMRYSKSFLHDQLIWKEDWFVLGIGQQEETNVGWDRARAQTESDKCLFLVCSYPRAAALRYELDLSRKDFRITLGFNEKDLHDCYKGAHSLLHNQLDFLETSSSRIISTPADLVEAATTAILGGNPDEKAIVDKRHETMKNNRGRFRHASILLDAAEGIMSLQKPLGKPFNNQNASSMLFLFHNQSKKDELLLDILEMRCHILGRKRDFGNTIEHADI